MPRQRRKPKALDLFCCGGGAGEGLRLAGFDVTGVDRDDHRAAYEQNGKTFVQADVTSLTPDYVRQFDFVWASPPCQFACTIVPRAQREKHEARWQANGTHINMIPATRALLEQAGVPYAIENVMGAKDHLRDPVRLCGTQFGLSVYRHRYIEVSGFTVRDLPKCNHRNSGIGALSGGIQPVRREKYANDAVAALRAGQAPDGFEAREVRFPSHGDRVDHIYIPSTEETRRRTHDMYKRGFARSIMEALRITEQLRSLTATEQREEQERYESELRARLPEGAKQMYPIYGLTKQRGSNEEWADAMGGLHGFSRHELREAIPPAYSKWVAESFLHVS